MIRNNFVVFFILFVSCNAIESNEVSLENVIKQILNISPPEVPVGKFHGDQQPPKHMLELYHRFTSGRRASGETVRSITPNSAPHVSVPAHLVLFNISLSPGGTHRSNEEEVRLAQLVLRRRRLARHPHPLHRKLLAPPCRVRLYQLLQLQGRVRSVPLASIPVPQVSRGGWHSLDITSAVRELLLSSPGNTNFHTLGVRFEAPRSKVIPPSHFLDQRDNTSAFLMLFSEESSDNDIPQNTKKGPTISREHIELIALHIKKPETETKHRHHSHHSVKTENPRRHKNKENEEEETDIQELINMNQVKKMKRHKKLFDGFDMKYDDERESEGRLKIKSNLIDELLENSATKRVIRSVDTPSEKSHKRRSIYDNELPYEKLHIKDTSKTLTTTTTEVVTEFTPAEEEDDKNLIPYPPGMEKKKKRKSRRGKKRNHKSKITKIPDEWNKEDRERHRRLHGNKSENSSGNQTCTRRHLVVNFKDLGWSDWIIEPKLFNAHYCAGSCNFPVPESVPVTNHAIIQSLVHDHGLHKGVPAPCCVPHSMSPLTILYLEDDHHVILKNYRSMTVETCGCR